jgi:hypothetical protein
MKPANLIRVRRAAAALSATDLDHDEWQHAAPVALTRYWSGEIAPPQRHAEARLLWTPDALLARFVCEQGEPLVVRAAPDTGRKVVGLWDFDVCEIFVAPEVAEHYFEFEVAPTGEWLDVEIHWRPDERTPNWHYQSGMRTAARIETGRVTLAVWIPWTAFGRAPRVGERWRGNLFRCVGAMGEERGYLAWLPTKTPQPAFHVPQAFGWLEFAGKEDAM